MHLIVANRRARVVGEEQLGDANRLFHGNDASRRHAGVPNFERVRVEQVYRDIDIVIMIRNR